MSASLDIKHLKMIYTIANSSSVKAAADALFITQPALSNRIKEAERRLGCQLFVRRGRKLVITQTGKRLLLSASRIIEELERAEYDISRLSKGVEHTLRLSLSPYTSCKWLPGCIDHFALQFPHVELEVSSPTNLDIIQALKLGDVDVAITTKPMPSNRLDEQLFSSTRLFRDEMLALVPTGHPFTNREFLTAADFKEETYITNSTVPERGREYDLLFKPEGVTPQKVHQVAFIDAILEMVQANMGVTIMNRWALDAYSQGFEFTAIALTDTRLFFDWYAIAARDSILQEPVQQLVEFIQANAAEVCS